MAVIINKTDDGIIIRRLQAGFQNQQRSALEVADRMEKQEEVEYTKDGSVDLLGSPAIRKKLGGRKTLPFTLGIQFISTVAYYGIATNLVLYLTKQLHQNTSTASINVTNWTGFTLFFSVIGALLGDSYFGRYWTSISFVVLYLTGLVLATLTTGLPSLKPRPCIASESSTCPPETGRRIHVFYLALYIQALGFGGFQPCNIAFGADQFDEQHEEEKKRKSLFFSLTYVASSCGGLLGNTFLIYLESNVSYKWGYTISTGLLATALVAYVVATPIYRYKKPEGNPLTRIAQVLVAATRKWHLKSPSDANELYEPHIKGGRKLLHSDSFKFLDKAAIKIENNIDEGSRNPWRLCTVTQVEETKILARILPIWGSSIYYSTLYVQIMTLYVEQASTLDNRLGNFHIPPASLGVFEILSVCFWSLTYERAVVPLARRLTGHPRGLSFLQRMGAGLVIATFAMVVAAVVEIKRLQIIKQHGLASDAAAVVPMSVFWLIPQYFLVGASETFNFVGQYEFFYDQAPDGIRGVGSCLSLMGSSMGNFLSSLLVTIVTRITKLGRSKPGWIPDNLNDGHIDYFYWLLVVLSVLNLATFMAFAIRYKYINVSYVGLSSDEADSPH